MENLKKLVSNLLVLSMIIHTMPAFGIVEPQDFDSEDEMLTPQNPPGTPAGVQCSGFDQTPNIATGGVCCVGLELNSAGKCDEPAFQDTAVTSCTANNQCAPGLGCLPQSVNTLYSNLYPTPDDEELQYEKKQELEAQVVEVLNPKPAGLACVHARDCESYSCVSGICEDKKVCRLASEGEFAGAGVNCGANMVKGPTGVCELSPEAQHGTYLGLLNEVTIEPLGQCQFKLDEETRKRSLIAMQSLRAMEWFFNTISVDKDQECFDVLPVARDEIGKKFFETRRNILANFTEVLNGIEDDYMKVLCARQPDDKTTLPEECKTYGGAGGANKTLIVHGNEIPESDLATRQTSGFDTLWLMKRRNQLFQSYELAMLETVSTAHASITGLNQRLSSLKDNDSLPNCEGSKYKKKKWLLSSWKTKYYDKVKDHWAFHYEVNGSGAGNAEVVKRDTVKKVLAIIGGTSEAQAVSTFTKSKYYLIDPMMFGGIKNSSYGDEKKLKKKSSFLGLFGGFKDLRKARYLKGTGTGSYSKMYKDLTPKLTEFYKRLKVRPEQRGFIYEPELFTTQAKDCLNNPEKPESCKDFSKFMEGVQDETFAHFLAWGYATKDSYTGFFSNAQTYRRRLLRKIITDMQNISRYYETVIRYRNEQNACIDTVLGGIAESGILTTSPGGLNEGSVLTRGANGGSASGTLNSLSGSGSSAFNNAALQRLNRTRFMFDLKGSTLSKLKDGALFDNIAGTGASSDKGGIGSTSSAFLSQREDALRRANAKAKAKGVDIASKEKAIKEVIDSMTGRKGSTAGSGSGSGASLGTASNSNGSGFGNGSAGSASVSATAPGTGTNTPEGINGNAGEMDPNKVAEASAADQSGIGSAFGSGYGDSGNEAGDPNAKDSMGLTDADKERMLSEYERNKKAYQEDEDDGLFNKVSKAYVRNLEKVLKRKKRIEP